jgi:uncharacterized hydrophobic protein (TIGR00271 family)
MVVGPEYNAIIAVALGLSLRDRPLARDGSLALLLGFFVAIVVTLLFGLAVRASGDTPAEFLQGVRPVADLINTPNMFSVIVAILAGLVGVISLTESRANALIGVFISVTTIPAAASVGVSVAYASWSEAWGSLEQLLLNVVLLIVVGAGGLSTQRMIWRRLRRGAAARHPELGLRAAAPEPGRRYPQSPARAAPRNTATRPPRSTATRPTGTRPRAAPEQRPAQPARLLTRGWWSRRAAAVSPGRGGYGPPAPGRAWSARLLHSPALRCRRADLRRPGVGGRLIYDGFSERADRPG